MKKHLIALVGLIGLSIFTSAQTKKIAFESHSGNLNDFSSTLNNEFFDGGESNYGLPSTKSKYKLDSVIFINDTATILVSKEYKGPFESKSETDFKYVGVKKDTLYNHSLLKKKNPIDSIRRGMSHIYGAWDVVETSKKTVFVGFSKKGDRSSKQKENQIIPVFWDNRPSNNSPLSGQVWLMVSSILALSLAAGFLTWKLYKPQPAFA